MKVNGVIEKTNQKETHTNNLITGDPTHTHKHKRSRSGKQQAQKQ